MEVKPTSVEKRIEAALDSYHKDTPKKLRQLREMIVPSSIISVMSKADLSELTGVSPQNVGKIEKEYGETNSLNASIKYLIKIAIIFDIDLNWLCGITDEPKGIVKKSQEDNGSQEDVVRLLSEISETLKERLPVAT